MMRFMIFIRGETDLPLSEPCSTPISILQFNPPNAPMDNRASEQVRTYTPCMLLRS